MPAKKRLSHAEMAAISKESARRVGGTLFSLSITPLPAHSEAKAAVVVSKKISPKAAARNLLRRRSREVIRPLISHLKKPVALIFHAKISARDASFVEIKRDIDRLIAEIR